MPEPRTIRFDTLVAPHMGMLLRVAHRLTRNPQDSRDLVQDTCVAACEHPADLEASTHPVRWLLRVLHNRFIDLARRQCRNPLVALEDVDDRRWRAICPAPSRCRNRPMMSAPSCAPSCNWMPCNARS